MTRYLHAASLIIGGVLAGIALAALLILWDPISIIAGHIEEANALRTLGYVAMMEEGPGP